MVVFWGVTCASARDKAAEQDVDLFQLFRVEQDLIALVPQACSTLLEWHFCSNSFEYALLSVDRYTSLLPGVVPFFELLHDRCDLVGVDLAHAVRVATEAL